MSVENILKPHNLSVYLNEVLDKSIKVSNIDSENTLSGYLMEADGLGNVTWVAPTPDTNIYNSDGTVTGNRIVNIGTNKINFTNGNLNLETSSQLEFNSDPGSAFDYLQKDNSNNPIWAPLTQKHSLLASRFQPYIFPAAGTLLFNTQNLAIQYTVNTLTGIISLNNSSNETIMIDFNLASAVVSDSSTKFRFDIIKTDGTGTQTLTTGETELCQSGGIGENVNLHLHTFNGVEPNTTLRVDVTRVAGTGSLTANPLTGNNSVMRPHTIALSILQI